MQGIIIKEFKHESELQKKGLEVNDIIVELDDVKITSIEQFESTFQLAKELEKEKVKLVILKKDKNKYSIKINPLNDLDFTVEEMSKPSSNISTSLLENYPNKNSYSSNYSTAIGVSKFIAFLGWLMFSLGIIGALTGISESSKYGGGFMLAALLPSIGISLSGLFLVVAGQVTKATVDNADHTREILALLRNQSN